MRDCWECFDEVVEMEAIGEFQLEALSNHFLASSPPWPFSVKSLVESPWYANGMADQPERRRSSPVTVGNSIDVCVIVNVMYRDGGGVS